MVPRDVPIRASQHCTQCMEAVYLNKTIPVVFHGGHLPNGGKEESDG